MANRPTTAARRPPIPVNPNRFSTAFPLVFVGHDASRFFKNSEQTGVTYFYQSRATTFDSVGGNFEDWTQSSSALHVDLQRRNERLLRDVDLPVLAHLLLAFLLLLQQLALA